MDTVKAMSKLEDILKNLGIPEELIQPDALLHRDLQLDSTEKIEISCQAIYGNMMRTGDKYKCDRGLPISIYIQLGTIPNLDIQFNLSPCDYVSQAIVYLSKQSESLGKAFYLRNPQSLTLQEMAK